MEKIGSICILNQGGLSLKKGPLPIRGVFQKYAERFHRMFAIAAMLMIFHVRHAWHMLIKYR